MLFIGSHALDSHVRSGGPLFRIYSSLRNTFQGEARHSFQVLFWVLFCFVLFGEGGSFLKLSGGSNFDGPSRKLRYLVSILLDTKPVLPHFREGSVQRH